MKKLVRLSMLLALAIVLSIIESFIPIFNGFIPGLKLGLANIVIVFVLYLFSFKDALYISIMRVILVGILRAGLFSVTFFFSLGGALLSVLAMFLFKKYIKLSIIGISIVGAIFHSIGQLLVALILINNINWLYYLPILLLSSIVTGLIIGLISKELLKYFETNHLLGDTK